MITTLLEADTEQYDQEMKEYDREMLFAFLHPKLYKMKIFLAQQAISWFHKNFTCRLFGCKIDVESHATPDYGYEDWWCKRGCGAGDRIHFY